MPLDHDLAARMAQPDFWPLYSFDATAVRAYDDAREEAGEEDEEEFRTRFLPAQELGLELRFEPGFSYVDLAVVPPGVAEPEIVGWDDTAHFHPHVMSWSELDLLCRATALHDPTLRHPGPMSALLLRFAFLTEQDDLDTITPFTDAAFAEAFPTGVSDAVALSTGPTGTAPADTAHGAAHGAVRVREETRAWFDQRDLRGTGVTWSTRPDGHRAVHQEDESGAHLYSSRAPEATEEEFPFTAWSRLLRGATATLEAAGAHPALRCPETRRALDRCAEPDGHTQLGSLATTLRAAGLGEGPLLRAVTRPSSRAEAAWVVETLGGFPQGRVTAAWFGRSPLADARTWYLDLTLAAAGHGSRFGTTFAAELSAALGDAGLGWAETTGSTSVRDAKGSYVHTSDLLTVLVRDDLPAAARVIARRLHEHGALRTADLRHSGAPRERVPLPEPS
ncbi:hypothetical protein [Streptomyces sp. NPDC056600]|uniref:hypothetical protein n=1 Tax=Streptomyces sp. NPDC056600 TaxID=3345874 RepID=UPI0036B9F9AD